MKKTLIFDLGGTLVQYYERYQFPGILRKGIKRVIDRLENENHVIPKKEIIWSRVWKENYESKDHRVRPLEGRLSRIFQLDPTEESGLLLELCGVFMGPIFELRKVYADTFSVLEQARLSGFKMAIVSNTPWGSPSHLWREEVEDIGLSHLVDRVIFCRDVGWRKPARQIFSSVLESLDEKPDNCIFIGDDPRWDIIGPKTVGIETVLIRRSNIKSDFKAEYIRNLNELWSKL